MSSNLKFKLHERKISYTKPFASLHAACYRMVMDDVNLQCSNSDSVLWIMVFTANCLGAILCRWCDHPCANLWIIRKSTHTIQSNSTPLTEWNWRSSGINS